MFYLVFGIVWMMFIVPVCIIVYTQPGGLLEKLFPLPFIAVGIYLISTGVKTVYKNSMTKKKGVKRTGLIVGVYPNGTYVNGMPQYNADILVSIDDYEVRHFTETIGFRLDRYFPGVYVSVLHHNDDINILDVVSRDCISNETVRLLNSYCAPNSPNEESPASVIIDGVEYVRKN